MVFRNKVIIAGKIIGPFCAASADTLYSIGPAENGMVPKDAQTQRYYTHIGLLLDSNSFALLLVDDEMIQFVYIFRPFYCEQVQPQTFYLFF